MELLKDELILEKIQISEDLEAVGNPPSFRYKAKSEQELQKFLYSTKESFVVRSTSCNWGLGANYSEAEIELDLSEMREFQFDESSGVLSVQPGVSQKQVSDYLLEIESKYFLDVTGSASFSSIMGNLLERGISYHSQRWDSLISMEVYLKSGKKLVLGLGTSEDEIFRYYKYSLGPDLKSLFSQSDFGVVSRIHIQLKKRPDVCYSINTSYKSDSEMLDGLMKMKDLIRRGVIEGIPHIANRERSFSSVIPWVKQEVEKAGYKIETKDLEFIYKKIFRSAAWSQLSYVAGEKVPTKWNVSQFKKKMKKHSSQIAKAWQFQLIFFLNKYFPKKLFSIFLAMKSFFELSNGVPTNAALGSLASSRFVISTKESIKESLGRQEEGFLYLLPVFPFHRESVESVLNLIEQWQEDKHRRAAITINPLSHNVLEAVISFRFMKQNAVAAHKDYDDLKKELMKQGAYPYRLAAFDPDLKKEQIATREILKSILES